MNIAAVRARGLTTLLIVAIAIQPVTLAYAQGSILDDTKEIRRTQELLMEMLGGIRLSQATPIPTDQDKKKVEEAATSGLKGLDSAIGSLPTTDETRAAKNALVTLNKCKDEATSALRGQSGAQLECNRDKMQGSLDTIRSAINKSYETCTSMFAAGKEQVEQIKDINVMSADDRKMLPNLMKGLPKGMDECIESAKNAGEHFDSAMNSMTQMMNMAMTMCGASGGNPYVCGAFFVFAMLTALFQKGGGDGDGKGPSKTVGSGGAKPGNPPNQTRIPSPTSTIGVAKDGSTCTVEGGEHVCRDKKNTEFARFPVSLTVNTQGWAIFRKFDPKTLEVDDPADAVFDAAPEIFRNVWSLRSCGTDLKVKKSPVKGTMIVESGSAAAKNLYLFAWQDQWRGVMQLQRNECPSLSTLKK